MNLISYKNINLNSLGRDKEEALANLNDKQVKILLTNLYDEFLNSEYDTNDVEELKFLINEKKENIYEIIDIINKHKDYTINPSYYFEESLSKIAIQNEKDLSDYKKLNNKMETLILYFPLIESAKAHLFTINYLSNTIYYNMKLVHLEESNFEDEDEVFVYPESFKRIFKELIKKIYLDSIFLQIEVWDLKTLKENINIVESKFGKSFLDEKFVTENTKIMYNLHIKNVDHIIEEFEKIKEDGFIEHKKDFPLDKTVFNILEGVISNEEGIIFELDEEDKIDVEKKEKLFG